MVTGWKNDLFVGWLLGIILVYIFRLATELLIQYYITSTMGSIEIRLYQRMAIITNTSVMFLQQILNKFINNLREKFSLGPGFEPGSPALCAVAITTKLPKPGRWHQCFPEGNEDLIRGEFQLGPVDRLGSLVVIAPVGDPGSNPGPGENFFP